ncbi:MAG: hypothetical protein GAK28_01961 [Luteibacter sp.]|nr:MAG: hypothetical protein GAK28_01961 [Luteibacter sp.]
MYHVTSILSFRRMTCLLALLVAGCAQVAHMPPPAKPAAYAMPAATTQVARTVPIRADFGTRELIQLRADYAATPEDCGSVDEPAFLCSGVLIRITGDGVGYHVWNPSPGSVTRGGVSFSYLRSDVELTSLVWSDLDGLIFSPPRQAYVSTLRPDVMCAYPVDADTFNRPDRGCGQRTGATTSGPCQTTQGVYNDVQWLDHFTNKVGSKYELQCGFTTIDIDNAAPAFFATIKARQRLADKDIYTQNEVMLATWPQDVGASLPIQFFFYLVEGDKSGLTGAQRNQLDLLHTDGIAMPVVKVTLPADRTGQASFDTIPADQVIEAPALPASITQSPSIPLAPFGYLALADLLAHDTLAVVVPRPANAQPGDTVRVLWQSPDHLLVSSEQPLSAAGSTTVALPRGALLASLGRTVQVSYRITSAAPSALERASAARTLSIEDAPMHLPPPVVGADQRRVSIDYPDMAIGDDVYLYYYGRDLSPHIAHTHVDTVRPITTLIGSWFDGVPGRIHYTVTRAGTTLPSPEVTVGILPRPVIDGMLGGWLYLPDLATDPHVHVPPWEAIANGQRLWLDVVAYAPDGTARTIPLLDGVIVDDALRRTGADAVLPRAWLSQLPDGGTVQLLAAADTHGGGRDKATPFTVTRFTVRGTEGPMTTRPLPRLVGVDAQGVAATIDGVLSLSTIDEALEIRVAPWPGMLAGQTVWLQLRSRDVELPVLTAHPVTEDELTHGLVLPIDHDVFKGLSDGAPLDIDMRVAFEKGTDEARALRFPVEHLVLKK